MCIICNVVGEDVSAAYHGLDKATDFLHAFRASQEGMKRAADAMLAVSKIAVTPEDRKRYDAIHKDMVRQMREWNKLEEKREVGSSTRGQ